MSEALQEEVRSLRRQVQALEERLRLIEGRHQPHVVGRPMLRSDLAPDEAFAFDGEQIWNGGRA